jgi:ferrous iron transport protein B
VHHHFDQRIALIGNPNCGKTTLFNGLTGTHQRVGNWPGVTIEKKSGRFKLADERVVEVVDLPGIYSLEQEGSGLDEQVAQSFLEDESVDVLINILDATCLDRQLLLTHQLREFKVPMLVVVNMLDVAEANQLTVNLETLSESLGLPVIGIVASRHADIAVVKSSLSTATIFEEPEHTLPSDSGLRIRERLKDVGQWVRNSVTQEPLAKSRTERIDDIVLHRFIGVPVFLLAMYLLFTVAINVGAVFIDFFDLLFGAWLVDGVHNLLSAVHAPYWLGVLLADGVGGGIQLVSTFIPVVGFLYLGLSVLEESGYIVRAAFVVDRLMQSIGLPGRAFVPLIVGFGCNVPAIMATRTLDRQADRMITMAMAPFMSCGARLPVYALFGAAFFGGSSQNVVFGLYILGIVMAVATGWVFRKAFYHNELSSSIMEMPVYHIPSVKNILFTTWHRLKGFVTRAGETIVIVVVILSFLNSWGTDGTFGHENSQNSVLSAISKKATPLLSPFGVQQENWPATVGVITGVFAKEAVVGTLDSLYADIAGLTFEDAEPLTVIDKTKEAFVSVWVNAKDLSAALIDPLGIKVNNYDSLESAALDQDVRTGTFITMMALFVTPFAAFCYLIFILLYTPCVAVVGALVREAGSRWAWVVVSWSTILAYATATMIYQVGTFTEHWLSSIAWIIGMMALIVLYLRLIQEVAKPGMVEHEGSIPLVDITDR